MHEDPAQIQSQHTLSNLASAMQGLATSLPGLGICQARHLPRKKACQNLCQIWHLPCARPCNNSAQTWHLLRKKTCRDLCQIWHLPRKVLQQLSPDLASAMQGLATSLPQLGICQARHLPRKKAGYSWGYKGHARRGPYCSRYRSASLMTPL